MKKIVQIKKVPYNRVTTYLKEGWSLYGEPRMPIGNHNPLRPYQCVVKYSDEERGEKVVEYKLLEATETRDRDRELLHPNICKDAEEYIKSGYQPYGPLIEIDKWEAGFHHIYQCLAMVKYE